MNAGRCFFMWTPSSREESACDGMTTSVTEDHVDDGKVVFRFWRLYKRIAANTLFERSATVSVYVFSSGCSLEVIGTKKRSPGINLRGTPSPFGRSNKDTTDARDVTCIWKERSYPPQLSPYRYSVKRGRGVLDQIDEPSASQLRQQTLRTISCIPPPIVRRVHKLWADRM